jgi:hypothetical protein
MRKAFFGIVLLLLAVPVYSQSPLITWTTCPPIDWFGP